MMNRMFLGRKNKWITAVLLSCMTATLLSGCGLNTSDSMEDETMETVIEEILVEADAMTEDAAADKTQDTTDDRALDEAASGVADGAVGEATGEAVGSGEQLEKNNSDVPLEVTTQLLSEEDEELMPAAEILGNPHQEYIAKILISMNKPVNDFVFRGLNSDIDSEGTVAIEESQTIGAVAHLDANQSVVVAGDLGEVLPVKGISFEDSDGTVHYYYLLLSGYDGQPILEEYKSEQK